MPDESKSRIRVHKLAFRTLLIFLERLRNNLKLVLSLYL